MFTLEMILTTVARLSVVSVFIAVAADFLLYDDRADVVAGKKSVVATGSMGAYFAVYGVVLLLGPRTQSYGSHIALAVVGVVMIVAGAAINIWGRLSLRQNWANHIKIYDDHQLVTSGAYRIVRHPLYASLLLMLLGGALMARSWPALLLTQAFVPVMRYRARQEEELLTQRFAEYAAYQRRVGMFIPRIGGRK